MKRRVKDNRPQRAVEKKRMDGKDAQKHTKGSLGVKCRLAVSCPIVPTRISFLSLSFFWVGWDLSGAYLLFSFFLFHHLFFDDSPSHVTWTCRRQCQYTGTCPEALAIRFLPPRMEIMYLYHIVLV
ncbi:hypothetical protein MAPG_10969 [Magnaporthiopsis poae ATCC 64411]|uniref:Uncharacterized protein n=1 Tax=Magnaporthiopsis poae (strain ATCC 64411 / 73-15) TaxID=644358 RepID=A0A0C4EE07_MAGP6|nr:hypothetical protein MAPG_10969 [Magnaporthiopsis poae ATCC 64411]